jgi:hypothetical protein
MRARQGMDLRGPSRNAPHGHGPHGNHTADSDSPRPCPHATKALGNLPGEQGGCCLSGVSLWPSGTSNTSHARHARHMYGHRTANGNGIAASSSYVSCAELRCRG